MKRKGNNKTWYIWIIVGAIIGIIIGQIIHYKFFKLVPDINIIDVVNLFVTVGLALYIARILDRKIRHEQFTVDLFIAKIDDIESQIKSIENLIQEKDVSMQMINTKFHVLSIAKNSLLKSIDSLLKEKDYTTSTDEIKNKHKTFKLITTNTPIDKTDTSVVVKNGKGTYSVQRISEIMSESYALKDEYFKLKVLLTE